MTDYILMIRDFIFSPIGMLVCAAGGIILAYFILTRYVFTEKEDTFEIKTIEEAVTEDLEKKFDLRGIGVKSSLYQGMNFMGTVKSWIREQGYFEPMMFDTKKREFVVKPNATKIKYDLYIFRIDNGNFLTSLLGMTEKKYAVVDSKHLIGFDNDDKHGGKSRRWVVHNSISFQCFGGAFITSDYGKEYISDISIKNSHENVLTHLMNYPNKVVYIEMEHAKRINYYLKKKEIDSKMWEKYKRGSDVETEGDNDD